MHTAPPPLNTIPVGIDAIGLYTSAYYLDLADLAKTREIEINKFNIGLGQYQMSIIPPNEDIVSLGANAAWQIIDKINPEKISTLLFATESAFDGSKAAGIYLHRLLNLSPNCRVIEFKQACYAATGALQLAASWVETHPQEQILIIASDVARYALNSSGESSQGCGAVAMLITANPKILTLEPYSGTYTEDVMDFWRPVYSDVAFVEGKYSSVIYLKALEASFKNYQQKSGNYFNQIDYFCFHAPVPKLVEKAYKSLLKLNRRDIVAVGGINTAPTDEAIHQKLNPALDYARKIGNTYTASLYISFASLLDNTAADLANKRVGFYSYGSGCVAEYFTGIITPHYQNQLLTQKHQIILEKRERIDYAQYEKWHQFSLPQNGSEYILPNFKTGKFYLEFINHHKRFYSAK